MGLFLQTVFVTVFVFIINHCITYWFRWGHHIVDRYNHAPGPCYALKGPGTDLGSEDLTILPNGLVLISSGLWRDEGRILLYDFNADKRTVEELPIEGNFNYSTFVAHGLSAWVDPKTKEVTLFVVNHHPEGDRVELFQLLEKERKLRHLRSVTDPIFAKAELNDVVGLDSDKFYASKPFHFPAGFKQKLEQYLMTTFGKIVYYDGSRTWEVAEGFNYANGINVSPDKKYLYLAEYITHDLHSFKINSDGSLTKLQTTRFDSGIDNLEVDHVTGDIWIGAHPSVTKLYASLYDRKLIAPSQVIKVKTENGLVKEIVEAYYNTGEEVSGSSVASVYKGKMLVGSVAHNLLVCDIIYML